MFDGKSTYFFRRGRHEIFEAPDLRIRRQQATGHFEGDKKAAADAITAALPFKVVEDAADIGTCRWT
jgi:hypothetical protein